MSRAQASTLLLAILFSSLLWRFLLADRRSYWFDELLSVGVYGAWNSSLGVALDRLAQGSIHPPLFQTILYGWMTLFGDAERATRTLSSLLVGIATYLVYRFVRTAYTERVALAATLVFALSATATYYGGEARSYALTLALSIGSACAAMRLMQCGLGGTWRLATTWPALLGLTLTNAGLLLTHYFNGFFLAAEGLVLGLFVLREFAVRRWPAALGTVALSMLASLGILAALWGSQLVHTLSQPPGFAKPKRIFEGPLVPVNMVTESALSAPRTILHIGLLLAALLVAAALVTFVSGRGTRAQREQALLTVFAGVWFALPLLVTYVLDATRGFPHFFHYRHIIYVVTPLLILTVLVTRAVTLWITRLVGASTPMQTVLGTALLSAVVAGSVLPGTLDAATDRSYPVRELSTFVTHIVRTDPDHKYAVAEANYAPGPTATSAFYLDRSPAHIKPLTMFPGRTKQTLEMLDPRSPAVRANDYLIVFFPHVGTKRFESELEYLGQQYRMSFSEFDSRKKHGIIVFDLHPASAGSAAP